MHLYAIQDKDGNVKIGKSKRPHSRLSNLQCGNANQLTLLAVCLVSNPDEAERHFHDTLGSIGLGMVGEWFRPSLPVTIVVNSMMNDDLNGAAQMAMDLWCDFAPINKHYRTDITDFPEDSPQAVALGRILNKAFMDQNPPVEIPPVLIGVDTGKKTATEVRSGKFDRTAYQREYMRKRRAKKNVS